MSALRARCPACRTLTAVAVAYILLKIDIHQTWEVLKSANTVRRELEPGEDPFDAWHAFLAEVGVPADEQAVGRLAQPVDASRPRRTTRSGSMSSTPASEASTTRPSSVTV